MNDVLVSIVMPVYNVDKYLEEAVNSIFSQTYKKIQLIAVNDGSSDDSLSILQKYSKKSCLDEFIIVSQDNQGLSGARNKGISYIKGKYTYFFDSDDILDESCIQDLVEFAEFKKLDMIRFDAITFEEDNFSHVSRRQYKVKQLQSFQVYTRDEFVSKQEEVFSPVWLYFFKSDIIHNHKLKFLDGILHEDELFTPIIIFYIEKIGYISNPYFKRRYREGSIMTSIEEIQKVKHVNGYYKVLKNLFLFEKNKQPFTEEFNAYIKRTKQRIGNRIIFSKYLELNQRMMLKDFGVSFFLSIRMKLSNKLFNTKF